MALLLVIPLVVGVAAPPPTRGDELSDARTLQKQIAQKIAHQRSEIARLKTLQANLSTHITATAGTLGEVNANLSTTRRKVARLSDEISQVRAVYLDLVAQVKDLDAQIVSLEAQQTLKAQELADRKAMLTLRLRDAYRTDRTPIFQQLLSAGSIADVFEDVGSYLDFGSQDRDLALQIEQDQQTLATLHETLTDARAAKAELRAQTLDQKKQLDAQMKDLRTAQAHLAVLQQRTRDLLTRQKTAWSKMHTTTRNLNAMLAREYADQQRLATKIKRLLAARIAYGHNIPSAYNGTLHWPMAGSVTQEFGCTGFAWEPPLGSCSHFHQGIDVAAPKYTPIRAAGAGTVVFAGPNPYDADPKAWIVIIAHSQNLQTWYAHVDNAAHPIAVHAGQVVAAGAVIAYEGMTGHTTGPHLHWAVMFNGQFVNPRLFT